MRTGDDAEREGDEVEREGDDVEGDRDFIRGFRFASFVAISTDPNKEPHLRARKAHEGSAPTRLSLAHITSAASDGLAIERIAHARGVVLCRSESDPDR
jgi:hypothetical protein